jgi:hypothetical protein
MALSMPHLAVSEILHTDERIREKRSAIVSGGLSWAREDLDRRR